MLNKNLKKRIAKIAVLSILAAGSPAILSSIGMPAFSEGQITVMAAETGTVTVTCNALWTYSRAAWAARAAVVNNGATFTVVDKVAVEGRQMYKLDNGRYITANTAYVSFKASAAATVSPAAPSAPASSGEMVTTANLYMRTGPGTSYSSVRIIPSGAKVTSYESKDGWIKLSYGGSTGWSSGKYLKTVTVSAPAPVVKPPVSEVTTSHVKTTVNLNMRKGAGTSYSILATMPAGTVVPVSGTSNGWMQVTYNGKTGWASGQYLQTTTNYSEKILNLPYINQYSPVSAPMGCEGASLLMALQFKGSTDMGMKEFLEKMPTTERNPFKGFASTPFALVKGTPPIFQSIFPEALTAYGKNYNANMVDISGYTTEQLKAEIDKGNPVIAYVTGNFETPEWKEYDMGDAGIVNTIDNMHIMVLTGYNSNGDYHVTDPASSKNKYWVSKVKFETSYNALKWAVVVR